ncbi:MAG: hypothetical protein ABI895_19335 [Deltaproteobacteria bacterium]
MSAGFDREPARGPAEPNGTSAGVAAVTIADTAEGHATTFHLRTGATVAFIDDGDFVLVQESVPLRENSPLGDLFTEAGEPLTTLELYLAIGGSDAPSPSDTLQRRHSEEALELGRSDPARLIELRLSDLAEVIPKFIDQPWIDACRTFLKNGAATSATMFAYSSPVSASPQIDPSVSSSGTLSMGVCNKGPADVEMSILYAREGDIFYQETPWTLAKGGQKMRFYPVLLHNPGAGPTLYYIRHRCPGGGAPVDAEGLRGWGVFEPIIR